jgi:hypothetical protein
MLCIGKRPASAEIDGDKVGTLWSLSMGRRLSTTRKV